jgi:hypothetical protein
MQELLQSPPATVLATEDSNDAKYTAGLVSGSDTACLYSQVGSEHTFTYSIPSGRVAVQLK